MNQKDKLIAALGKIIERDIKAPGESLSGAIVWDSLCVVVAMAEIEAITGRIPSGEDLARCETVADVLRAAGIE